MAEMKKDGGKKWNEDPISFSHNLKKKWDSIADDERKSSIGLSIIENQLFLKVRNL